MKCIGGCPGELLVDSSALRREARVSPLTIQGTSADVCGRCGEVVYGSRRSERRLAETQRARRVKRPSNGAMRKSGWGENDWDR
jgi:hypothetical protein